MADQARLQTKRNSLVNRIEAWRKIQEVYMPSVGPLLAAWKASNRYDSNDDTDTGDADGDGDSGNGDNDNLARVHAEDIPLFLPSALSVRLLNDRSLSALAGKEGRLRVAIADDALASIRRLRRTMAGVAQFKHLNVSGTGQKPNTRIRNLYDKFKDKTHVAAMRYRAAYSVLPVLQPNGEWSTRLRPLADKDIRGPGDDDDSRPLGEGHREVSWIWRVARQASTGNNEDEEVDECMRIEWMKTRARARRWREEVQLLQEEMRRVLVFFEWKATWWRDLECQRHAGLSTALCVGLAAYAEKQARMYEALALKFQNMWVPFLMVQQLRAQWVAERARTQDVDNPNQPEGEQAAAPARIPVEAEEVEEGSSASDEEMI